MLLSRAVWPTLIRHRPIFFDGRGYRTTAQLMLVSDHSMSPVDPQLHQPLVGVGISFIELGRFDEALVAGKKGLRQNPSFPPAYRCLASAFAHLGRVAEAREAAARVLQLDPAFTISGFISRGGQLNARQAIEGFRKAGLPE
jgi:adenylate cyclase